MALEDLCRKSYLSVAVSVGREYLRPARVLTLGEVWHLSTVMKEGGLYVKD